MKKRLFSRTVVVASLLALLVVIGGTVFVADTVPTLPSEPLAPVLDMPPPAGPREPYSGEHPRLQSRPAETFNFPIMPGETGPTEPLFAGPLQYPFFCGRDRSRPEDTQPLPDNDEGLGIAVFAREDGSPDLRQVLGYSKDCRYPTQVRYYYKRRDTDAFFPLEEADGDIQRIAVMGRELDYVVRLETGTINRFIYAIAALRGEDEDETRVDPSNWNGRLIYQFRGGVGIGRRQGDFSLSHVLNERSRELQQGYAVAYSTANQTRNHFNINLAEDTAWRVKRQFSSLYGEPLYTVGVGGSGGAIQQYLFAQNAPGLLDAAIALYSYPDVITQTTHIQDCELLEYFMDITDRSNPQWRNWENRTLLQGMNADSSAPNRFAPAEFAANLLTGRWNRLRGLRGATECISGWRGLTPLMSNPRFIDRAVDYSDHVRQQTSWTHWADLSTIYGRDDDGHAYTTWDNVGVQYGLDALRRGQISWQTFLDLNRSVGGWKPATKMQTEKFWFLDGPLFPVSLTFWSEHNMTLADSPGDLAPRTEGNIAAMRAARLAGQVFTGAADIPVIDARHYLDDQLDMHHLRASFAARARMQQLMGHADNQLVWVTRRPHDPQPEAFELIELWMQRRLENPDLSARQTRPEQALDRCTDAQGNLIAEGDDVWDGEWNQARTPGACTEAYPSYRTSRQVAGDLVSAEIFKCHLIPVGEAISRGFYGDLDVRPHQPELEMIFPGGVCDYQQGDMAMPDGLIDALRETVPEMVREK